ncbi:MAG TPA: hypothetical protein VHU92_22405 [Streptosporangiaceae bacterium]|nr:hypothetical protein [Streptosporangiaceae bacterium]
MATPTVEELMARLEEQQARIELLESRSAPPAASPAEQSDQHSPGITRRGLVAAAAAGTAGLVGGMLLEPGAALASTTSPHGPESFASSTSTPAVTATNTGKGNAIMATGSNAAAVHGSQKSSAASTSAIKGTIDGKNGAGIGVWGLSPTGSGVTGASKTGIGVTGTTGSTASGAAAIEGTVTSTSPGGYSTGVRGVNNGTGGSGIGVYGSHNGSGWGVYGYTPGGSGVYGYSNSGTGVQGGTSSGSYGVSGQAQGGDGVHGSSSSGNGVSGTSTSGTAVSGSSSTGYGVYGSTPNNYAVVGVTTSGNGVYGQVSAASQAGLVGRQLNSSGNWAVYGFGNIGASGTKSAVVPAADGNEYVTLYCMESPECWFEDFGSAKLAKGSVTVRIDPEFAGTVLTEDYFVFVQAEGECRGLYVSGKTGTSFVVRELDGGASSVAFSYRIVARRKDVSAPRLNRVTLPDAPRTAR